MNDITIKNKSDAKSISKATRQNLVAKLYKIENNIIIYTVSSSKGDKQYIVKIQLLDLGSDKVKTLRKALLGNLKISCSCPAFLYQGFKYITYKNKVGIEKETRPPDIRNPEQNGFACKHIIAALNKIKQDYKNIEKQIIAQTKINNAKSVGTNNTNNTFNENDITLLEQFKQQCLSLYKEYTDYLNSDNSENVSFKESDYYSKIDPVKSLSNLSEPIKKILSRYFIGKLKSVDTIINYMIQKKQGFNVLVDSDVKTLTRIINSNINAKTEALINNIILDLIYS